MKRKLAIGAAGLLALGGAGAAYGVTQGGKDERQAFLNDAAKRLNVSPDKLQGALQGAFEDRLGAAVKAGRITQAEANAIKKKIEQGGGPPVGIPGFGFGAERHFEFRGGPGGPIKAGLDAAASYLDLTPQQLIDKLGSGKSLADVASDQKKSVDGLKSAIKDSVKKQLDQAVTDKKITQDQENKILDGLDSRIDDVVNRKGGAPGVLGLGFGPKGFFFAGGPIKAGLDAAAKYLGLTDKELAQKVESGKSLADVASDQKKSVDGLKSAIKDSVKKQLDQAVTDKKITQDQENKILDGLDSRLDDVVNRKGLGPPPGFRRHFGPDGKRSFHFGSAPPPPPGDPVGPII
jgi:ribosomal protein S4